MIDVEGLMKENHISWRKALTIKQRYLCSLARKIYPTKGGRMIGSKVADPLQGWMEIKCVGFQMSKEGSHIMAKFRVISTGDLASVPYKFPVRLREMNPLLKALGITDPIGELNFPEVDDSDMLGFDTVIQGNIIEDGKYLNVKGFRPSAVTPGGGETPF